uniref:Cytochrome b5 heme-binding domain-containing protein n=1 Tax=Leersia perrieri TaxID=77586 RepID=A0A0D9X7H0_9ORYZ
MEVFVIVSVVMLLVLGALFVIPKSRNKGNAKQASSNTSAKTFRSYTKEEISAHNTRTDCWVIIKDKVYDVTSYVEEHPGGDAILNNAGGDSTEGFFGLTLRRARLTI